MTRRRLQASEIPADFLSPAVKHFLARVDSVWIESEIKTACTRIQAGRVEILLGETYLQDSPEHQAGTLAHEAGHWYFGTWARQGDRNAVGVDPDGNCVSLWNIATDATINHFLPPEQLKPGYLTYAALGAPILTSEALYDWLLTSATAIGTPLCSNASHGSDDGSCRSKQITDSASLPDIDPGFLGARQSTRLPINASLRENDSAWLRQVLEILRNRALRGSDRKKSWSRERRGLDRGSLLLPGRLAQPDKPSATILVDVSGSCSEIAGTLLGALAHCPYLAPESRVVFFDHQILGSCMLRHHKELESLLGKGGGGTLIAQVGEERSVGPAIWLTDAYSADGFPAAHLDIEIWIVAGEAQAPPNGITIRA